MPYVSSSYIWRSSYFHAMIIMQSFSSSVYDSARWAAGSYWKEKLKIKNSPYLFCINLLQKVGSPLNQYIYDIYINCHHVRHHRQLIAGLQRFFFKGLQRSRKLTIFNYRSNDGLMITRWLPLAECWEKNLILSKSHNYGWFSQKATNCAICSQKV